MVQFHPPPPWASRASGPPSAPLRGVVHKPTPNRRPAKGDVRRSARSLGRAPRRQQGGVERLAVPETMVHSRRTWVERDDARGSDAGRQGASWIVWRAMCGGDAHGSLATTGVAGTLPSSTPAGLQAKRGGVPVGVGVGVGRGRCDLRLAKDALRRRNVSERALSGDTVSVQEGHEMVVARDDRVTRRGLHPVP